MNFRRLCLVVLCLYASVTPARGGQPEVSFSAAVRPLLSDRCFACHGPDEQTRAAGLRLDRIDAAIDAGVIVPGSPEESELLRRLTTDDPDQRMPPLESNKSLSAAEIESIRGWIEQGAPAEAHWSYRPLTRPSVPAVRHPRNGNPIDAFLLKRLLAAGHDFAPPADRRTLVRRLYLDLLGVPPTFAEAEAFIRDEAPDADRRLVDRLLRDQRYGERMAVFWLDLVRYADTIGYHSDNQREVSAYRDYVIDAFNQNLPFDRFTIEQLAGDLLPDPTLAQRIASGYNRLLQTTAEGGAQAKEYTAIYAADRVRNFSAVWLGQTIGCAQCHDHKYDPYTIKDFYSLAAFFADLKEVAVGQQPPNLMLISDAEQQQLAELERRVQTLESDRQAAAASQTTAEQLQAAKTELDEFRQTLRTTLVAEALDQPRMTRILPRGNWLDDSGAVVEPAVPEFLPHQPIPDRRGNRFDLAQWVVAEENPLTARAAVNRIWKLFFGVGLAPNLEDLGGQGQPPTHPELLDWLAVEFRDSGWDVKALVRLMLTSSAYQQSSTLDSDQPEAGPANRLYHKQSAWRIEAEFVRDTALSLSGLLVSGRVGGQSVKPYQPAGYWQHLNFPKREWQADQGEQLYRRSLYTFWCRTFPHPSLVAFDAPSREECTAERPRSNIPQQALVLLNDPIFVEAARCFAERILRQPGLPQQRIEWAVRQAYSRDPEPREQALLAELLRQQREHYRQTPQAAQQLITVGRAPVPQQLDAVELAAWTQVARVLINAYECTSRY